MTLFYRIYFIQVTDIDGVILVLRGEKNFYFQEMQCHYLHSIEWTEILHGRNNLLPITLNNACGELYQGVSSSREWRASDRVMREITVLGLKNKVATCQINIRNNTSNRRI